jgi:hypothetical protein
LFEQRAFYAQKSREKKITTEQPMIYSDVSMHLQHRMTSPSRMAAQAGQKSIVATLMGVAHHVQSGTRSGGQGRFSVVGRPSRKIWSGCQRSG